MVYLSDKTEYTMSIIRLILGRIIILMDWLFTPSGVERDTELQTAIDLQTAKLALYQYNACPFCVKVRRAMKRQSLNIETRDAKRSELAREQLLTGTGILKVPCLRIEGDDGEVSWIFESADIIDYLEGKFAFEPVNISPSIN
jgi:glutaredoxin